MAKRQYHCNFIYNSVEFKKNEDNRLATDFVYYLDKKISGWGILCYIGERDCLGGANVFDELFRIVSETDKCLVVITPEFRTNYWAKYSKQAALKYLLEKENQHKMIPITLNIDDSKLLKELNVNKPFHMTGKDEEEWEIKNKVCMENLEKTLREVVQPHVVEEGDNQLHTEVQHQIVTIPSSATVDPSNSPFFAEGQRLNPEPRSTEYIDSSLQETSFLSVDSPTNTTTILYDRLNKTPQPHQDFPRTETNERQEEHRQVDSVYQHQLRLDFDVIDGFQQFNSHQFTILDSGELSVDDIGSGFETPTPVTIDDIGSGFETPRPVTIGGNESVMLPWSGTIDQSESVSFLEVTDETSLKQPYSRKDTFDTPENLQQGSMPLDLGYTTPSDSVQQILVSRRNIECHPENHTEDQKQKISIQDSNLSLDYSPAASISNVDEGNSKRLLGMVGQFLSLTVDSFLHSDVAFK